MLENKGKTCDPNSVTLRSSGVRRMNHEWQSSKSVGPLLPNGEMRVRLPLAILSL